MCPKKHIMSMISKNVGNVPRKGPFKFHFFTNLNKHPQWTDNERIFKGTMRTVFNPLFKGLNRDQ